MGSVIVFLIVILFGDSAAGGGSEDLRDVWRGSHPHGRCFVEALRQQGAVLALRTLIRPAVVEILAGHIKIMLEMVFDMTTM